MRVTNAPASRKRRTRMIRAAKGFRMRRSKLYRYASDAVDHGRAYAYRDRKTKKRNFRALWQIRINAAARAAGTTYSRFMEGLKAAKVALDRKVLADIAATDAAAFTELVKSRPERVEDQGREGLTFPIGDFQLPIGERATLDGSPVCISGSGCRAWEAR